MTTKLTREGADATVTVCGRFTSNEAEQFLGDIESLTSNRLENITIDLSGMDYISSAGIRCFVMLLKSCNAGGTRLTLKNLTPQIKDIFSLTSLLDKFNVE